MTRTVLLSTSVVLGLVVAFAAVLLIASTKPANATFPGANGKIVIEGEPTCTISYCGLDTELFSVDPASRKVSNLTNTPTKVIEDATLPTWLSSSESLPQWSPDGKKLLFLLLRYYEVCDHGDCYGEEYTGPEPTGLYTMKADGSGKTRISGYTDHYAWSPNGKKIAYGALGTMNADGSGQKRIFVPQREGYVEEAPVWSRDGRKLAFITFEWFGSQGAYFPFIHVINADGTGHRKFAVQSPGNPLFLNWTPDGKKLLFGVAEYLAEPYYDFDLFSVKADGSRLRNLTRTPSTEGNIAWEHSPQISPDGKKVGFTKASGDINDPHPQNSFYTMNPDGSALKKSFTFSEDDVAHVGAWTSWVWSPDSKKVAFVRAVDSPRGYRHFISTTNVDGSGRKNIRISNLTSGAPGISDIDWQLLP